MSASATGVSRQLPPWYLPASMRTRRSSEEGRGRGRARSLGSLKVAVVGVALVLGGGCGSGSNDGVSIEATIQLGPCVGAAIADAKCGTWTVEENRAEPNGRRIELSIFVAPATSRTPAKDPVFLLAGGPGQGAAEVGP